MQPITDVGPDVSPDGVSLTRQPTSDIDRLIAAKTKENKSSDSPAIKDLEKVDESDIPAADIQADDSNTDISLDDFLSAAGKELSKEPTKENEDDKTKDLEQTTKEGEKTTITKPDSKQQDGKHVDSASKVTPKADKTIQRDYSDIDEEHQEMFKRMHNDAYNFLKPIYKEHKTLKAENEKTKKDFEATKKQYDELKSKGPQLPDSYYENPNGYLLNPEFQVAVRDQNDAQVIFNHWNKQYNDVAAGAKEIDILNYDNQGNLVITGKVKADAGVEAKLLTYITQAQHNLINKQALVQSIAQTHTTKTSEAIKSFNAQIQKEFAPFETPENKPIYDPLIKQEFESLHPTFRNSPLALAYAKSRVMVQALVQLLKQASQQQNDNTNKGNNGNSNGGGNKTNTSRNKQPSAAEITGEVNGKKGKDDDADEVTMDDFNKVKAID